MFETYTFYVLFKWEWPILHPSSLCCPSFMVEGKRQAVSSHMNILIRIGLYSANYTHENDLSMDRIFWKPPPPLVSPRPKKGKQNNKKPFSIYTCSITPKMDEDFKPRPEPAHWSLFKWKKINKAPLDGAPSISMNKVRHLFCTLDHPNFLLTISSTIFVPRQDYLILISSKHE